MLFHSVLTTAILAPVVGMHFSLSSTEDVGTSARQQVTIDADGTVVALGKNDDDVGKEPGKELKKAKKPRRAKRLCHRRIVRRVCSKAFGGGNDKRARWDQIASAVSASETTVTKLRTTLKLEVDPVKCRKLCKALVRNLRSAGATVPERSDEACACKKGKATCGVDVGERKIRGAAHILKKLHNGGLTDAFADNVTEGKGHQQDIADTNIDNVTEIDGDCPDGSCVPYTQEELVASLARLFHIFPNFECGNKTSLLQEPLQKGVKKIPSGWNSKIQTAKLQAQAWTDFARGQLKSNAGTDELATWFGGRGDKSKSTVKKRVKQSLNWISTKISGAQYLYVPDNFRVNGETICEGSPRTGGTVAFVWNYQDPKRKDGDFRAASVLKCGRNLPKSQWLENDCVLDAKNNLIVYMCQKWASQPEDERAATVIHELIHHTGPSDVAGYDSRKIQAARQAKQIENAENYAELVVDIVDGDCLDTKGWLTFQDLWTCSHFEDNNWKCDVYGASAHRNYKWNGQNANEACCACGGGIRVGMD